MNEKNPTTAEDLTKAEMLEKIDLGIDALIIKNVGHFLTKAGHIMSEEKIRKICLNALSKAYVKAEGEK